jgi:hypothetical protein
VSGFLLVKEEADDEGASSRTLRARMDTQTAYIVTLEEDNLRLRERLLRVESELKAVQEAQHGGSRVCSTDASEGSMEEGERPPSQHRSDDDASTPFLPISSL